MSIPKRYRKYETVIVLNPDMTEEEQEQFWKRLFEGIFKKHDGHVLRTEVWGRRRLAYTLATPRGKFRKGVYHYVRYLGDGDLVRVMERAFRLDENVLRYLTIKLDEGLLLADVDFDAEAAEATPLAPAPEESSEAAAQPQATSA